MNLMEDLKAYVDGELSPERQSEIESAMEQDERLRQELEEIRVLSRLIGDCVLEPEPVGLERTLLLLEARKPKGFFRGLFTEPKRFGWVYALALFILAAIVFPKIGSHSQAEESVAMMGKGAATGSATASAPSAKVPTDEAPRADSSKAETGFISGGTSGGAELGNKGGVSSPEHFMNGTPNAYRRLQPNDPKWKAGDMSGGPAEVDPPLGSGYAPKKARQESARVQKQAGKFLAKPLLVRTSDVSLRVPNVQRAQVEAENVAKSLGGYVEQSSGNSLEGIEPSAQLVLRVPEPKFQTALVRLRSLGTVISSSVTGTDVTADVADAEARLKVMRAEEASYVDMLRNSRKVSDSLEIKDRLSTVRQEIESLSATGKALRSQATYSTITLSLSQVQQAATPVAQPTWFDRAWKSAAERASGLGQWLAEVGMNLLVLSPIWIPIVVGLWWFGRRSSRMRR